MSEFKPAVVIPCAGNRLENLKEVLKSLMNQTLKPEIIVVECDGFDESEACNFCEEELIHLLQHGVKSLVTHNEKHVPYHDTVQPKNAGVLDLEKISFDYNAVWFVDSDIIMDPTTLESYKEAWDYEPNRILIGPYEWLPPGHRVLSPELRNDPRTQMFYDYDYTYTSVGELNFALANFGGNIIYPRQEFIDVGGFWNDLSAGRVEDGEMGLRCQLMKIPMCVVPKARGYHLAHEINTEWVCATNDAEVPRLNERHPWVQNEGLEIVEEDGKRFNWINPETGESVNTLEIWNLYGK